ncbi:MAG: VIT1/CCC1 transporter family protein [Nitrospinota bacterium]
MSETNPPPQSSSRSPSAADPSPGLSEEAVRHPEAARLRAKRAFYREEHIHGSGYTKEVLGGLTQGLWFSALLGALWMSLGLRPPQAALALLAASLGYGLLAGLAAALASAEQIRFYRREVAREREEIEKRPEWEKEELRALYYVKGLRGELLERTVETLASDRETLLRIMMEEELGIFAADFDHPLVTGLTVGVASAIGALPGAAVLGLAGSPDVWAFAAAGALVGVLLAGIGVAQARVLRGDPFRAAASNVMVGLLSGATAYAAGGLLSGALGS